MTVGQKIRKLRRNQDLTQAELGKKSGIDARNLTRYENDHLHPSMKVLKRIAEALGVAVDELIEAEEKHTPEIALHDKELLQQFQAVEQMDSDDKEALKRVIQAMILKTQIQGLTSRSA